MARDRTAGWAYVRRPGAVFQTPDSWFLTSADAVQFAQQHPDLFSSARAFDNLGSGVTNRANVTCSSVRTFGSVSKWFDTSCFTTPGPLQPGTSGSGKVHGPGFYNADVSLSKTETIREQVKITVQADAFNMSNTPHYSNPDTNLSHANFGQISGANGNPRQFQLGAHLTF